MTLQEDKENLAGLEERRAGIVSAMAKISSRFVVQLGRELPDRWEQIVQLYIAARPDDTMELGSDGLAKLKAELSYLKGRSHQVAMSHLSGTVIWAHEGDGPTGEEAHYRPEHSPSNGESKRWSRVSDAISEAEAEVLGLLTPRFGTPEGIWIVSTGGKLSHSLEAVIKAYQKLNEQLQEVDVECRALLRAVKAQEAQELWENA